MTEAAPDRIPRRAVTGYAVGSVGTGGFGTLPGLVLAYYLTDTIAVPALLATVAVLLPKIWDVLIDPAVGALSDREIRARGTRTRLMTLGALTLPIGFIGMFAVPDSLGPTAAAAWVAMCFILATTSFSLFQVPYIALPADLTQSYTERTRLMGWRIAVLALAILLVGAGGPALRDVAGGGAAGYLLMGVVVAVVIALGMMGTLRGVRGQRAAPALPVAGDLATGTLQGYRDGLDALRRVPAYRTLLVVFVLQAIATGIMLAAAQDVATYTLGEQSAVTFLFVALVGPALVAMPLWTRYGDRHGKQRALTVASAIFTLACMLLMSLAVSPGPWVYLPVCLAGVAYAGMQLFPLAMLPDVITAAGRGRGGAMSGLWTAAETGGLALGPGIVLGLLAMTGFRSSTAEFTVTQPESALLAIVLAFSVIPGLLVWISMLMLHHYRDPHPTPHHTREEAA